MSIRYWEIGSTAYDSLISAKVQAGRGELGALLTLVYLRISQLNGCSYCIKLHTDEAIQQGESAERLQHLDQWRGTLLFSKRERAALGWAEAVTLLSKDVLASRYEDAVETFSPPELVDLTVAVATMNALNRLSIGFGRGRK